MAAIQGPSNGPGFDEVAPIRISMIGPTQVDGSVMTSFIWASPEELRGDTPVVAVTLVP